MPAVAEIVTILLPHFFVKDINIMPQELVDIAAENSMAPFPH